MRTNQMPQGVGKYIKNHKRRKKWLTAVTGMACVVVFCITYALILPAITMESDTYCGFTEHQHGTECFEKRLICGYDETEDASTEPAETGHVHTDDCYEEQQVLVCGLEESSGHIHDESCMGTEQQLVCSENHEHIADCYETVTTYTCGKTEGEGSHTHEAACYETQKVLICEIPESEPAEEPHVHTEDCYEEVLICQLEEHEHSLACRSNPEADVETAADWEKTFEDVELTGKYSVDLLQIARTQLGYTESEDNYAVETDPDTGEETAKGYTRYGAWYGDAYSDWCAMYISFCLNYADIPAEEFPRESSAQTWVEKLSGVTEGYEDYALYREASTYTPEPGDLVFFDWDQDGKADHVGIVTALSTEEAEKLSESDREYALNDVIQALTDANLSAGNDKSMTTEVTDALPSETDETTKEESITLITIEGNSANKVQTQTYSLNDAVIMGYGKLPEKALQAAKSGFTVNGKAVAEEYEASAYENLVSVKVTFQGDAAFDGQLPENFQPVLMLEVSDDDPALEAYESDTGFGLLTLRLHLYADEEQTIALDISNCSAQVELTLGEALLPGGMSFLSENGEEPTEETTTYLTVYQGEEILATEAVPETAGSAAMIAANDLDAAEEPLDENIRSGGMTLVYTLNNAPRAVNVVVSTYSYNPSYTIQHYFWFPQVQQAGTGSTSPQVSFINTEHDGDGKSDSVSDKVENGKSSYDTYDVNLTADDYHLETKEVLKELFIDEETTYQENPQVQYMSRLYNSLEGSEGEAEYNENYTLSQIWVYQPGYFADSNVNNLTNADFVVYNVPRSSDNSTALPERIRFTNNPANAHLTVKPVRAENGEWAWDFSGDSTGTTAVIEKNIDTASKNYDQYVVKALSGAEEGYNYDYTILIGEGTIVRLVMEVTTGDYNADANFFDYNITDGFIYETASTSTSGGNQHPTTDQYGTDGTPPRTWYAYTAEQGINSTGNYNGSGAKFAFGNSNTSSGLGNVAWTDGKNITNHLNEYNHTENYGNSAGGATYKGLTFGLVQSIASNGTITWANGINGLQIFEPNQPLTGKFDYNGTLTFYRQGGTYTLSSASVNDSDGRVISSSDSLRQFQNTAGSIYSNEFWVMDGLMGNKVPGHDLAFGDLRTGYGQKAPKYFGNTTGELPCSDTSYSKDTPGDDHNSYFGMSYQVNFTIDPGYSAPLMYWFYGDDDMWVFLDKKDANGNVISTKQVADIGGVHSSAGMMVNLWDYVEKVPFYVKAEENTPAEQKDADGNLLDAYGNKIESTPESYSLRIYYTERGASGSTCYMRFTVPLDSITQTRVQGEEVIVVEKELQDEYGQAVAYTPATEENPRPTFAGVDLTYFDEYDASDAAQAEAHNAAVEWVEEQAAKGYFIYRIRLYDSGSELPYQDLYHYGIYRVGDDHTRATALATGDLGSASTVSGDYYFALRSGEYIAITGLFEGTAYSVRELTSEKYLTSYQVGSHTHANGAQEDTLNPDAYYGDRAGTPDRLTLHSADGTLQNYVKFFNSPSTKTETDPGNGKQVNVGDIVTYEIEWINDTTADASVTINDLLDLGVDFVAAWFGGSTQGTEGSKLTAENVSGTFTDSTGTITYDVGTRKVTWSTQSTENNDRGIVTLQVRVNEDAKDRWNYFNDPDGEYGGYGGGSDDYQIVNQAQIVVTPPDNTPHIYLTNIPYNPVRDTRASGIYKVDQYGNPVEGATFAAYKTGEEYAIQDGVAPTLTITTGAKGEVQFMKDETTPYTLAELKEELGNYFVLKETKVPEGYRTVSEEIHLYFDGNYLLVDGRTVSGASSAANATVTVNSPYLYSATPRDGKYYYVNGTTPYYTTGSDGKIAAENGTLFAVVLKKNGSDGTVDEWYPVVRDADDGFSVSGSTGVAAAIDAAQSMGQSTVFTPNDDGNVMEVSLNRLPGSITQYFTYQWEKAKDDSDRTIESVRNKSEYFVAYYYTTATDLAHADAYNTTRIVSRDGIITGTNNGVEGNNGSDPNETYPGLGISWGTTIQITNYENRLFFQKRDANGNAVNGAVFALYNVGEDTDGKMYYIANNETHTNIYLAEDTYGNNAGSATVEGNKGTYQINAETGGITVKVGTDSYTITPVQTGTTHSGKDCLYLPTSEDGSGHFTNLNTGYYVMREISAPEPYALNTTEVKIAVDDSGVYANCGDSSNGIDVGKGPGYLAASLSGLASQTEINETLTWISMVLKTHEGTTFASLAKTDGWKYATNDGGGTVYGRAGTGTTTDLANALITYLAYDASGGSSVFNYSATGVKGGTRYGQKRQETEPVEAQTKEAHTVHTAESTEVNTAAGEGTRRLYTDHGWTKLEIYQDYGYGTSQLTGSSAAYYQVNGDISALFSQSTFIVVTDQQLADLQVVKTDESSTPLSGAKFALFRNETSEDGTTASYCCTGFSENGMPVWKVLSDGESEADYAWISGGDGVLTLSGTTVTKFQNLSDGEYELKEISPPNGYYPLTEEIKFTVSEGTIRIQGRSQTAWLKGPKGETTIPLYTLTVPNSSGFAFPETGGAGTTLYMTGGLLLMLAAALLLLYSHRKRGKEDTASS